MNNSNLLSQKTNIINYTHISIFYWLHFLNMKAQYRDKNDGTKLTFLFFHPTPSPPRPKLQQLHT